MNNLSFISNNVKGIQAISKRTEIFEYLKNYVTSNGFIFLQETHSSVKDEKVWSDEFERQLFFSHGTTNSSGVAIGFMATKALKILNIKRDNLAHILVIEVKSMPNDKSPGNDGLTKESIEIFWSEVKKTFLPFVSLFW